MGRLVQGVAGEALDGEALRAPPGPVPQPRVGVVEAWQGEGEGDGAVGDGGPGPSTVRSAERSSVTAASWSHHPTRARLETDLADARGEHREHAGDVAAYSMADHTSGAGRRRRASSSMASSTRASSQRRASPRISGPESLRSSARRRARTGHGPPSATTAYQSRSFTLATVADRSGRGGRRRRPAGGSSGRSDPGATRAARRTPACTEIGQAQGARGRRRPTAAAA